jgi:NDP-sugar pyrophosphorylase family protein
MSQAVIIAGGKSTRMRPYTEDRPKAMAEIAGRPIVAHQLEWLAGHGVEDVVISVGYQAKVLEDYVGDGSRYGLNVGYAYEREPLGRGGGLRLAAEHLPDREAEFFALNGDILARFDLGALRDAHRASGNVATIALAKYRSSWGVVELDENQVTGFVQSPVLPYWINGGIYYADPAFVELLPKVGDHEDSTFPTLAREGRLGGFRIEGYWRGIDTVKDMIEASAEFGGQGRLGGQSS